MRVEGWKDGMVVERFLADKRIETMDQAEVVVLAMCCTLPAMCLCWCSCASAAMPDYFSFVVNGKRRCYPTFACSKCSG